MNHIPAPVPSPCHARVVAPSASALPRADSPALLLSAHRNLRGPYTFGGALVAALADEFLAHAPDLLQAHDIEVLTLAPALQDRLSGGRQTLTSTAVPQERTRFYSRMRTARLSHGLTNLLRAALGRVGGGRHVIVTDLEAADPTDQELVAILARRLDPALLRLTVVTRAGRPLIGPHATLLAEHTRRLPAHERALSWDELSLEEDLAARYLASAGTCADPRAEAAYRAMAPEQRTQAHDAAADALRDEADPGVARGALPWHLERGSDPDRAVEALETALNQCIDLGFYDATVDVAYRGRALLGHPTRDLARWWVFTTKATTSLAALGRAEEVEPLYVEILEHTSDPMLHLQAGYARAMLYTRHLPEPQKDHARARRLMNQTLAYSMMIADPKERVFQMVFNSNGLALVDLHQGRLEEALTLVTRGIAALDQQLEPEEHRLHRSVLHHNRGQLLQALDRLAEAQAEFETVIEADPNYPEYHFDLANLLRRRGRPSAALAAYDACIAAGPPFPEAHFNRADTLLDLGRTEEAAMALDDVLDLEPSFVEARLARGFLRLSSGEPAGAAHDAEDGLGVHPQHPGLLLLKAQALAETGDVDRAVPSYRDVLAQEPDLTAARFNLAYLLRLQGRWQEAEAELREAARRDPDDVDVAQALADLPRERVGAGG